MIRELLRRMRGNVIPIGRHQAMDALSIVTAGQLHKLIRTGLLDDIREPGARNLKLNSESVEEIAAWGDLEQHVLAVHLDAIREPDPEDATRPAVGFHARNPLGLTEGERELAWVGYWGVSDEEADRAVGGVLVGDIAGWVPPGMARRVSGWVPSDLGVRFLVESLSATELDIYTRRRFKALPGRVFQWVEPQ